MRNLQELQCLIDNRHEPVTVFFRDDDAGWSNDRLFALCERFAACGVALDLAVIPAALDDAAQASLCEIVQEYGALLHLHQHGQNHTNHQKSGRKCEFGSARQLAEQRRDIATGQQRLSALFGELIEPVFTPPWNRCTSICCQVLAELEFSVLSRIHGSDALDLHGLTDVAVNIDWLKKRDGERLRGPDFRRYATRQIDGQPVVGIMLHHAAMDDTELDQLTHFLQHLQKSPNARLSTILQIAEIPQPAAPKYEYACG